MYSNKEVVSTTSKYYYTKAVNPLAVGILNNFVNGGEGDKNVYVADMGRVFRPVFAV